MNSVQQRRLIAMKSPIQARVDTRPRCSGCGRVITLADMKAYWDGNDPHVEGCIPRGASIVPELCGHCVDTPRTNA